MLTEEVCCDLPFKTYLFTNVGIIDVQMDNVETTDAAAQL